MADEAQAAIVEARARLSAEKPKMQEILDLIDVLAFEIESFERRKIEHWMATGIADSNIRRVLVLEAAHRFLTLCKANEKEVGRVLRSGS